MGNRPPEYWDLFDKKTHKYAGKHEKHKKIPNHLYHKTVEVIVTDKQGHILITRRSLKKRYGAGLYEFPAGSVKTGETTAAAAVRELLEETSLKVQTLTLLSQTLIGEMMRYVYLGYLPDLQTATILLNPHETIEYSIITYAEWIEYLETNRFDLVRAKAYTKEFYAALKEKIGEPKEKPQKPAPQRYERVHNFGMDIPSVDMPIDSSPNMIDFLLSQGNYNPHDDYCIMSDYDEGELNDDACQTE